MLRATIPIALAVLVLGTTILVRNSMPVGSVEARGRELAPPVPRASVIFGGDMMFDRTVRTAAEAHGDDALFSCMDDTFAHADFVVANLEGPITRSGSKSVGSTIGAPDNYVFTFPTTTAPLLARHRVSFVTLGNNHILNFGMRGLQETRAVLDGASVGYFGDPYAHAVVHESVRGLSFAFIGFNQFDPDGWRAAASTTRVQIAEARGAGEMPIVFAHWGDEYASTTPLQRELAQSFADAGAVFIVGAHPHVVQEHAWIDGVPVYYSLGNMIFDQYWMEAVRRGLLLRVSFGPAGVTGVEEIPVELGHDRRTCPTM